MPPSDKDIKEIKDALQTNTDNFMIVVKNTEELKKDIQDLRVIKVGNGKKEEKDIHEILEKLWFITTPQREFNTIRTILERHSFIRWAVRGLIGSLFLGFLSMCGTFYCNQTEIHAYMRDKHLTDSIQTKDIQQIKEDIKPKSNNGF